MKHLIDLLEPGKHGTFSFSNGERMLCFHSEMFVFLQLLVTKNCTFVDLYCCMLWSVTTLIASLIGILT